MKGGTLIFFRPVLAPAKGGKPGDNTDLIYNYFLFPLIEFLILNLSCFIILIWTDSRKEKIRRIQFNLLFI
jgi:hypothetical protein